MAKLIGVFFRLVRWKNLVIVAAAQFFVYLFLHSTDCFHFSVTRNIFFIILSTVLIAAGGYLINDYSDVKIDVINKPDKLIVGRYISKRWALVIHFLLIILGVLSGALVNYKFALLNGIVAFVLWRYSVEYKYKFLLGNIVVSALMALAIIVVYFADKSILTQWLLFYSFFAFLTGLIREIIKDVEDMEGDLKNDCRTLPNVLGIYKTRIVIISLSIACLCILGFSCVWLFYKQKLILPFYLLFVVGIAMILFIRNLLKADTKLEFARLSRWSKWLMIFGIFSMTLRCLY